MNSERMVNDEDFVIQWENLTLKGQVGAGSFGTVWLGKWDGSDVAVKVFMKQDLSDERLSGFLREVEIMKRIRHPNIVLFIGAVTVPPNLSIVTEYMPRGNLYKILHDPSIRPELELDLRLGIALDVAKGMNYLHCSNPPIVHRDLKSANILVDTVWTAKICDFGISKMKPNEYLSLSDSGGTAAYMAPEVITGEPTNEKSDVYSFGVVFWELLSFQTPWEGMREMEIMCAVANLKQRLETSLFTPVHAVLVEACFAYDPRARPSFEEILGSFKKFMNQTPEQPPRGRLLPRSDETDLVRKH